MSGVSFVDLMGIKALAKVRPHGVGRRVCTLSLFTSLVGTS